jgi:hypothetical protein
MSTVSFNPALMTQPQNSFILQTNNRWIQGLTKDDWASRAWLRSGIIGGTVSLWGGIAVAVNTPSATPNNRQGDEIVPATTTQMNGFTVYDQGINAIQTPGSQVPTFPAGFNVPYYLFGSNARVPVPLASGVLASLENVDISGTFYWDTANYNLTLTSSATTIELPSSVRVLQVSDNCRMVLNTSGVLSWSDPSDAALIVI